ncbi:pentapeptide repeat-containing protein [Nostoc sp. LPT]|uniref:pentapeptide repeat-containing protein n=1 Tax=Nostoc sp. LPT TaxID=2815387 RepID=UPI001DCC9665|nr:pentapeptide repeat-containing protein [Nostoc sp. LPT]MBN4001216.1 pentapeptide repeat-containing protein [Nostoc sp. LPT]
MQKNNILSEVVNTLLFSAIIFTFYSSFTAGEQQLRNQQIYQAWQVINTAHGQPGNGGRIQALEFLNSEPTRIPWFWVHWERENLSGLEAPNAYLVPSLTGEKFGIQLSKADMTKANLQGAYLSNANLREANLKHANLQETYLEYARLQGAELFKANLQRAFLEGAKLQGAFLGDANLQGAKLPGANLQSANLYGANLQGAVLAGANLQEAVLTGANLQGANLYGADLQGAYLPGANLQGVNLVADLQKAKYTDNSTSQETCKSKFEKYPCPTIFPDNFDPRAAGMELIK